MITSLGIYFCYDDNQILGILPDVFRLTVVTPEQNANVLKCNYFY